MPSNLVFLQFSLKPSLVPFSGDILSIYLDDIQSISHNSSMLYDEVSPQYKALTWINTTLHNSINITSNDEIPRIDTIKQSYILATLFYATNGNNWTNYKSGTSKWLPISFNESDRDVCSWDGIQCTHAIDKLASSLDSEDVSYISAISLQRNNLHGSLPSELSALSKVKLLSFSTNHVTGTLPESYGDLANLTDVYFDRNFISGSIPSTFMNLNNLERIDLSENNLSGVFPTSMTKLKSLKRLWLANNKLSSTIPDTIGDMVSLQGLILKNNNFSGTIPSSIGQLTALESLSLNGNALNGTLPDSLGNLINVVELTLEQNNLSGTVPQSICNQVSTMFTFTRDDNGLNPK